MDSITQAVLGGAIQGALLGKVQGRRALAYGAVLATLPDLDAFIRYADPVSSMTYHRGFSHSLFVLTGLAWLLAWAVLKRWPAAPYSRRRLFVTLWLVLVTHPVLDAFTVYGTQLFWPLTFTPESWAGVFIIDPVYTVPMLVAVLFCAIRGFSASSGTKWLAATLAFSSAYLLFGLGSRFAAEHRVQQALKADGIEVTALRAVPMPLNTLIWRVIAKTPDGQYYEVVSSWFDDAPPERLRHPLRLELVRHLADAPLHARFKWFTGDWLRYDAIGDSLVVSDLRMGVPGQYTFRFKMAECVNGQWKPVTPSSWYGPEPGMPELKQILRRIVHQQPPLPLGDWAKAYLGESFLTSSSCSSRPLAPAP
jgi:inner membrane protein